MQVNVENPMTIAWAYRAMMACGATRDYTPLDLYRARHSVIYAVQFWVDIAGISDRAHTHLVRSHVGFTPWVASQRPDRGGVPGLRSMSVLCNAEALIILAQKRLCQRAFAETRAIVLAIRDGVRVIDPDLAAVMQPRCVWDSGCRQGGCGWYAGQCLPGDAGCYAPFITPHGGDA